MEKLYILYITEHTQSGNDRFLAYIPSRWKNQPWLVRLGGYTHTPPHLFTLFTITYKVAVNALAERADTLHLFHLYSYKYSLLYVRVERVYRTQMSKDRVPTLIGIFPLLCWRKGWGHVMYCDGSLKMLVVPIALACCLVACYYQLHGCWDKANYTLLYII